MVMKIFSVNNFSMNKSSISHLNKNERMESGRTLANKTTLLANDTVSFKRRDSKEKTAKRLEFDKSLNERKAAYFRQKIQKEMPRFIERQFTPNILNNLPIHGADAKETAAIHNELKYFPELLIKLHTTPGLYKNLPMHCSNAQTAVDIHKALADYPEVLVKIHTTPNENDCVPLRWKQHENKAKMRELLEELSVDKRLSEEDQNKIRVILEEN